MRNLLGLIYGMVYGIALVVPGLSGGTFLVIFGCYDTICEAFALNIKAIKKNILFLVCFGIGAVGGLIGFAHAIVYLLSVFGIQTNLFFMGLILGGIPMIAKLATEDEKVKPICIIPFLIGFSAVFLLFMMERLGIFATDINQELSFVFVIQIIIYSFFAAMAMIMPGISGAFILVAFGVYDLFMEALKGFNFSVLIPAAIGILLGIVVGAKLVLLVIKRYKLMIYSAIMGMVVGSVAPLFPGGVGFNLATLIGIGFMVLGGLLTVMLGKKEKQ
ncbi:MAG: DUF368 domain-containing protein [Lachnospiraceae bacterium]|nr:DUF368 domain-containing protein [Lachnospiraceae bacterium]